jgi:hypothetical protein
MRGREGTRFVREPGGNARYTGRQVWNRQRRDEVLIDVNDVALGHQTCQRWRSEGDWIWSTQQTHQALVTDEDFRRVQSQLAAAPEPANPSRPSGAPAIRTSYAA